MDGDARVVTFANGLIVRELIVDVDDDARRFSWAAVGGRLTHHNASMQVFPDAAGGTRLVWIADLLPDELEADIRTLMDLGSAALKKTVEHALPEGHVASATNLPGSNGGRSSRANRGSSS